MSNNKGSKSPGIDGVCFQESNNNELKLKLVNDLKNCKSTYKANPVKRILIPKSNGKMRPLGIPIIKDRALQSLKKLV